MRTIAVLTDLLKNTPHAARFAIHIARKMKANVLLFQVSEVPVARKLVAAGMVANETENASLLEEFGQRLISETAARTFDGAYQPEILTEGSSTEIVDVMTTIMENENICLIVTPGGQEHDLAAYILSDGCNRMVDWARVPVLVVPENTPLRNPEKIAFASQLHEEDINSIAELGHLMECFAAELMITHLNSDPSNQLICQKEAQLNRDLYQQLNSGGVYFRSIPDLDREKNWNWLKANKNAEMLAVVQQPREQMNKFFLRGQNESVTHHLTLPVLILPKRP
jgi:nucleotide-binding universal stress UspA family protein